MTRFPQLFVRLFLLPFLCFVFICCLHVVPLDVAQERTHNALIAGVENFKPSSLKRTDTKEKIVLPNAQGNNFEGAR